MPDLDVAGMELLVVALSGVQDFITQSRTTADLRAGSEIVSRLAALTTRVCGDTPGAQMVFPSAEVQTVEAAPNRVVVLVPAGAGADVAEAAAAAVQREWDGWVRQAVDGLAATPGMPSVQWVVAGPDPGGYAVQWRRAQAALVARKRVRDFPGVPVTEWAQRRLCAQSPKWPAHPRRPTAAASHEKDVLSAANWVKRFWSRQGMPGAGGQGFPSTSSIASAPFRRLVLDRLREPAVRAVVEELRRRALSVTRVPEAPLPGLTATGGDVVADWVARAAGPWVFEGRWDHTRLSREYGRLEPGQVDQGRRAAVRLSEVLGTRPAPYLAVVTQDLDGMGRFLGDGPADAEVTYGWHSTVSGRLSGLAGDQLAALRAPSRWAVPVYAGGDDLLAFAAAESALEVADECHRLVPQGLPSASSAVLFFHYGSPLRAAVVQAGQLLKAAKHADAGKHALAVGFVRRSGTAERTIQPWLLPPEVRARFTGRQTSADLLSVFTAGGEDSSLSPRLLADLTRDEAELSDTGLARDLYEAELSRLVQRHGGTADDATALAALGSLERAVTASPGGRRTPQQAARVAVFLRQQCRPVERTLTVGSRR